MNKKQLKNKKYPLFKEHRFEKKKSRKYLNDIGVDPLGSMYSESKVRTDKFLNQQARLGFDDRDIYNLETTMYQLFYERLKHYHVVATKYLNLEYHKIMYLDKEYTQLELLERMLEMLEGILKEDIYDLEDTIDKERRKEVWVIWSICQEYMWW